MFLFPTHFVESLLEEDLYLYDLTSLALGLEDQPGEVRALSKGAGVAAGVEVAQKLFQLAGAEVETRALSGEVLKPGDLILTARGPVGRLHGAYKIAQNVLEYAGGIATRTRQIVDKAKSVSEVEVLVTRKHFPGTKKLSLSAALAGGAQIHRTGLSDSILIFDQHYQFLGGIEGLAQRLPLVKKKYPERTIAVEVANPAEAALAVRGGADIVQLEKFPLTDLQSIVASLKAVNPEVKVVAAGGVNADNAADYAASGVDGLVTTWPFFGKPQDVKMAFKTL
ncbi:MAG: ModD protein [Deltaproteobacteria bacterium]|jgi:molybdenum transport protein|nr:ModD protein [Deltaproteobacteria bacterium]